MLDEEQLEFLEDKKRETMYIRDEEIFGFDNPNGQRAFDNYFERDQTFI